MSSHYYNEFDPKAAAWLRELILAGEIPEGHVDERSVVDVKATDLSGYVQCHFFAGVGGWPLALRLTGWPVDRPIWTASLPCQPFSGAGKQLGVEDERHLWPAFFNLVLELHPQLIFGEQVARAIGFNWLDGISADLEGAAYSVGAAVLGAHSVGAPHKRQRLYWMAKSSSVRLAPWSGGESETALRESGNGELEQRSESGFLADARRASDERGRKFGVTHEADGRAESETQERQRSRDDAGDCVPTGVGQADTTGGQRQQRLRAQGHKLRRSCDDSDVGSVANIQGGGFGIDGGPRESERHADERGQVSNQRDGDAQGVTICTGPQGHVGHGDDGNEPGRLGEVAAGSTTETGDAGGMAIADGRDSIPERLQRVGEYGRQPEDGGVGSVDDTLSRGLSRGDRRRSGEEGREVGELEDGSRLAEQSGDGREKPRALAHTGHGPGCAEQRDELQKRDCRSRQSGAWSNYELLWCRDEKYRRVESGTFPLVAGLPRGVVRSRDSGVPINPQATGEARAMRLRGYGNSIVPQLAAEFIGAYIDIERIQIA